MLERELQEREYVLRQMQHEFEVGLRQADKIGEEIEKENEFKIGKIIIITLLIILILSFVAILGVAYKKRVGKLKNSIGEFDNPIYKQNSTTKDEDDDE